VTTRTFTRTIGAVAAVITVALLLTLVAVGFVVAFITVTGWLGFQHSLGIDTQQSEYYDFVSGVGPMIIASLGFSGILVTAWKHINCEHPGCMLPGHPHPDHGRPVCRRHYLADVRPHHDANP